MPPAEPPGRRVAIHLVAVTAIVVSVVYLSWRAIFTVDLAAWWLAIPLLALEAHAVFGLVLYTLSLWDLDGLQPVPEVTTAPGRVAVLIPTYDEPLKSSSPPSPPRSHSSRRTRPGCSTTADGPGWRTSPAGSARAT